MSKFKHLILLLLPLLWACNSHQPADTSRTFSFEMHFTYPGDPVFVYDHLTGDISKWWDHSYTEKPQRRLTS